MHPTSDKPAWKRTAPQKGPSVVSLRALLSLIGAHEWRTNGIEIAAIGGRIDPYYGVFAPIRREYVDLVATAPLPDFSSSSGVAFDIGTGTGVLVARTGVCARWVTSEVRTPMIIFPGSITWSNSVQTSNTSLPDLQLCVFGNVLKVAMST